MKKFVQPKDNNGRLVSYITNANTVVNGNGYPEFTDGFEEIDLSLRRVIYGIIEEGVWAATGSSNYTHIVVPVSSGKVKIVGNSLYSSKYAFLASYNVSAGESAGFCDGCSLVTMDNPNAIVFEDVPADCNYLYIQVKSGANTFITVSHIYKSIGPLGRIDKMQVSAGINNNLKTELASLPNGTEISLGGISSESNYGQPGAKYSIPLPDYGRLHIFFKFRFTDKLPYYDDRTFVYLGGNVEFTFYSRKPSTHESGLIYPDIYIACHNRGVGAASTYISGQKYKNFNGNIAFSVRYIGDISQTANQDVVMVMSDSSIVIKHSTDDSVIHTVSVNTTDSVYSIVNALNAFSDIECVGYETTGKTYSNLLYDSTVSIKLVSTLTKTNSSTYLDNPAQYIPFAKDERVHTVEILIDPTKDTDRVGTSWMAFDGKTIYQKIAKNRTNNLLVIGSEYFPMELFDLHIGFDYEDAEIVTNTQPNFTDTKQLISNNNPKVIIWEGHGVDYCMDADATISDDMAVSTDRLFRVFEELRVKGYTPVSWKDIISWKVNGTPLPKRCYTMMMDDFRVENYMDYNKRTPFVKYDVKPGLAIIENQYSRADTITIDGTTWTVGECFDICQREGWFLTSHAEHYNLGNTKASDIPGLLKQFALQCDKDIISSEVLVYPYGSYANTIPSLWASGFKLAVMVTAIDYNCQASSDYYITRYEIGTRESLDDVLGVIV